MFLSVCLAPAVLVPLAKKYKGFKWHESCVEQSAQGDGEEGGSLAKFMVVKEIVAQECGSVYSVAYFGLG